MERNLNEALRISLKPKRGGSREVAVGHQEIIFKKRDLFGSRTSSLEISVRIIISNSTIGSNTQVSILKAVKRNNFNLSPNAKKLSLKANNRRRNESNLNSKSRRASQYERSLNSKA